MAMTVVVGCKLPHGLMIHLGQQTAPGPANDPRDDHLVVTGPGDQVKINGANHRNRDGLPLTVGGYGITRGIDKDAFEKWLKENKDQPAVRNGLIFVVKDEDAAKSEAADRTQVKSGTERLDYDNPMGDKSIEPTKTLEQARSEAAEQSQAG